VKKGI